MKKPIQSRPLSEERDAELLLKLNGPQTKRINTLLATGLWGNTASQCAMRLLDSALINSLTSPKP